MSGYGHDESAPTPGGMFAIHFVGVLCVFRWWALHYRNPSAMLLQCVQNTFTECSQRVRYLCVTYSPCKSMVFALQKYGFWRAKRGFLHCKSMVFVFWMLCCCNLFGMFWQSVRNILAIRQQHFGNPSAAFWQSVSSRRGPIYCARIYIFATHFVCVWLILKACNGSFAL